MRTTLLALTLLVAALSAQALERKYAVISLVGDRILVVDHQPAAGAHGESDTRSYVDPGTPALDNAVLFAIEAAVKKAQPKAAVLVHAAREPAILGAQEKSLESGALSAILDAAIPMLAGTGATHLILVTKERHEAAIELFHAHAGSGYFEGAGFYVDRTLPLVDVPTGLHYVGFLASFAYFRVSVVDLSTMALLKEDHVFVSYPVGNLGGVHPWDAVTPGQKVTALQGILRREAARVVPALLPPE
jgi:hypothetical protein